MQTPARQRRVFTPSQLNALARDLLEGAFPQIWVEGELGGLSRPGSGHLYFALKDANAQLRCALFRQNSLRLAFRPAEGQRVLARGRISLYEPRGDYQLIVDHLEPAGEGALRAALEALKAKLAAEGLFDPARKRSPPALPRRIGVLTSPRGAAVRDVISVVARRFPLTELDVLPVPVQGTGAAAQIVRMLERAVASRRYDVLLLTRGGGSLEDLWEFNDEALTRAVAASAVPLVSAVGHEIDTSLCDFAADVRAATPSAAAELLVPERDALLARLQALRSGLERAAEQRRLRWEQRLDRLALRLAATGPQQRLLQRRRRLLELGERLRLPPRQSLLRTQYRLRLAVQRLQAQHPRRRMPALAEGLQRLHATQRRLYAQTLRSRLDALVAVAHRLESVSPLAVLGRGYAVLRDPEGRVVPDLARLRTQSRVFAQLRDGRWPLDVAGTDQEGSAG
jgi:exodeoxyribonuclease VII large subunit